MINDSDKWQTMNQNKKDDNHTNKEQENNDKTERNDGHIQAFSIQNL